MKITLDIDVSELNVTKEALLEYKHRLQQADRLDFPRVSTCESVYGKIMKQCLDQARKETGM